MGGVGEVGRDDGFTFLPASPMSHLSLSTMSRLWLQPQALWRCLHLEAGPLERQLQ